MNIELHRWQESDFAAVSALFTHCNRAFLSNALPLPYTCEHARSWYESTVKPKDECTGLFRIIHVNNRLVGVISLICGSDVASRNGEISYVLADEYAGQGIMSAALDLFCAEAFEKLDILRISAQVFGPNIASRRVLEKNGFSLEGTLPGAVCKGGNIYDLILFGRLR